MILSTFSRSVWISVYIRAGIFSNGKRTPYFERHAATSVGHFCGE